MWLFRPRRNCSLSTLAAKKRTWMRSMITAMAKTRHKAIGYMPKPPPFQWCAIVSKKEPILSFLCGKEFENYLARPGAGHPPAVLHARPPGVRNLGAEGPGVNRPLCSRHS